MDRILRVWTVILLLCFPALAFDRIEVTVTPRRPEPGDRVVVRVAAPEGGGEVRAYLEDFRSLGGNFLVVHVLMDPQQAYYPSEIARNKVLRGSPSDYVETFLRHADRLGFPCLLSVSWDMTHNTDYATAPAEIRAVAAKLWALYGRHASLAGFYSYQEGSGTYLVPYLREFCGHVKALHPNLLTACAPYVDDPLLSGYLSMRAPLDMVVFQGMTMASFRTDNVKRYPLRRVRVLGVAADFIPFAPAARESVYPFYPYRPNLESVARLLEAGTVLVLPDVSGLHTTDSEFVKIFLERGGAVLAFGPQLPMGNTYDRDRLLGATEGPKVPRREIVVRNAKGGRARAGARFALPAGRSWAGWKAASASVVAEFEDGAAAVFTNRVGEGLIASFALDAATAAKEIPAVVRDVLDAALAVTGARRAVDVLGTTESVDLASCVVAGGARTAIVNHGDAALDVLLVPLGKGPGAGFWTDLVTGGKKPGRPADGALAVSVPARGYVCWEYRSD